MRKVLLLGIGPAKTAARYGHNDELKKLCEFLWRNAGKAKNASQSARIEFGMIRHNNLRKRLAAAKDDVASMLAFNLKAKF